MQPQKSSITIAELSPHEFEHGLLYMKLEYYRSYGSMQSHTYPLTTRDSKFSVPSALMTSKMNLTNFLT